MNLHESNKVGSPPSHERHTNMSIRDRRRAISDLAAQEPGSEDNAVYTETVKRFRRMTDERLGLLYRRAFGRNVWNVDE